MEEQEKLQCECNGAAGLYNLEKRVLTARGFVYG
jgi:hypothetical protein